MDKGTLGHTLIVILIFCAVTVLSYISASKVSTLIDEKKDDTRRDWITESNRCELAGGYPIKGTLGRLEDCKFKNE